MRSTGLENLLNMGAGRSKRHAANFASLERGYVELRHFSALSFFNGPSLVEQLDRIPTAMAMGPNQSSHLTDIFLRKFLVLFEWLGPVDKPVLAPAQPERLGRCNTDVATG